MSNYSSLGQDHQNIRVLVKAKKSPSPVNYTYGMGKTVTTDIKTFPPVNTYRGKFTSTRPFVDPRRGGYINKR